MNLIDGYNGGIPHIEADMIRDHNCALYGDGDYILPVGNQFAHTIVSNNAITIADGMASIGGARCSVSYGNAEEMTIENGTSGYYRHDLIVIEYSRNENGIESAVLKVVKGELASSEAGATDPAVTSGNIRTGSTSHQAVLKRVKLSGLTITEVETVMTEAPAQLSEAITNKSELVKNAGTRRGECTIGDTHIEWGTLSLQPSGANVSTVGTAVNFDKQFAEPPAVQFTIYGQPEINVLVVSATNVTNDSFQPVIYASNTTSRSVMWFAFGKAVTE